MVDSGVASYGRGSYVALGSQLPIEKLNGEGYFEKWQWKIMLGPPNMILNMTTM